ncbi:aminotransferase class III-fold pyridoxal phosphate-dependent enzyme [Gordonia sp. NPDC003376]
MTPTPTPPTLTRDAGLRARAAHVLPGPGGYPGHLSVGVNQLPPTYPQFYARGEGAHLIDVDGRRFSDAMCAWGPMVVGYAEPRVVAAQCEQIRLGNTLNGPGPVAVELAELLVDTVAHADWAMFGKNGNDATAMSLRIARAATGRTKILKARKAYHGASDVFTPSMVGVAESDRANIVEFDYNDLASLAAAADAHDGDVAAVIVVPLQHDGFVDQEFATPEFAQGVRELCDRIGAVLVLDEVRTGMRLSLAGAWEHLGVRPDLTALSKAIGNGAAISAVTGTDALKDAAGSIFITGSFWSSAAPMAAALATITQLREEDGIATMVAAGERLRSGLAAAAAGVPIRQSGHVQMPFMTFDDDADLSQAMAFCAAALDAGTFFHPWHNWFLSTAHTPEVVDQMIDAAAAGFDAVRAVRGAR